jgi:23S rRNA (cytidine1920-2'-O)/16S rRNA (cytidine1409-2'-O)-methyltransferase
VVKKSKVAKSTLLERLINDNLSPSSDIASKEIMAGLVRVNGEVVDKVGALVSAESVVTLVDRKEFVSRAAYKLESACDLFPVQVSRAICADVGACTGGFTEILLRRGASKVYAIDVGYGDLNWKVRSDPRVVVMERTNARYLEALPDPVSLVVIDVSFISLTKILPAVVKWLEPTGASIIALIKPQFEANREEIGEGGIIRDPEIHATVCARVVDSLAHFGLIKRGLAPSPILGTEGNKEFLLWAEKI